MESWYKVPHKRGQIVRMRDNQKQGRITSNTNSHIRVRWQGEKVSQKHHPHDLDYLQGETWLLGCDLSNRLNTHIEKVNEIWNK